jgi:hypothetical protein
VQRARFILRLYGYDKVEILRLLRSPLWRPVSPSKLPFLWLLGHFIIVINMLHRLGSTQMQQEIQKRVIKLSREQEEVLKEQTGVEQQHLTDD